jgi:hypothetical protein
MTQEAPSVGRYATDFVRPYAHDDFCAAFHKKDLSIELCRWCDALDLARSQERNSLADAVLSLLNSSRYSTEFDAGFRHAVERAAAIVRHGSTVLQP